MANIIIGVLLLILMPTLLIGFAWFAGLAYRILNPVDTYPLYQDVHFLRRNALKEGNLVPVSAKEIYQQRKVNPEPVPEYEFEGYATGMFPQEWYEALWHRRN